jgi:hypothetical protein
MFEKFKSQRQPGGVVSPPPDIEETGDKGREIEYHQGIGWLAFIKERKKSSQRLPT